MTATFNARLQRIVARPGAPVSCIDATGAHWQLGQDRTVRHDGRLHLEPKRGDWYSWAAFRSWRGAASREWHRTLRGQA